MKKLTSIFFLFIALCFIQLNNLNAQSQPVDEQQNTQEVNIDTPSDLSYVEPAQTSEETFSQAVVSPDSKMFLSKNYSDPSQQQLQSMKYADMMVEGKVLSTFGIIFTTLGAVMMPIGGVLYMFNEEPGIVFMSMSSGFITAGVGCLVAGTIKMKKAKRNNVSLSYNVAPTGTQLSLRF